MRMPRLFHVSEQPDIVRFEPRPPPPANAAVHTPVVWSVDEPHLPNYLVPRECPRVAFQHAPGTTVQDRERFLGAGDKVHVVAIESAWFERTISTALWVYEFAPESFVCGDATAGYFVCATAVTPIDCRHVENPLVELLGCGVELRVLPSLHDLASAVAASSLAFSCIRMRNAR